jgi:hypothetical protein
VLDDHGLLLDVQPAPVAVVADRISVGRRAIARMDLAGQQIDPLLRLPDVGQLVNQQGLQAQRRIADVGWQALFRPDDPVTPEPAARHEGAIKRPGRWQETDGVEREGGPEDLGSQVPLGGGQSPDHDGGGGPA